MEQVFLLYQSKSADNNVAIASRTESKKLNNFSNFKSGVSKLCTISF